MSEEYFQWHFIIYNLIGDYYVCIFNIYFFQKENPLIEKRTIE
jgi:hypothetical protein